MHAAAVRSSKTEPKETFTRQGSLRKVLPPDSSKGDLFGRQNEDLNRFYKKFHQEYVILAEYKMLQSEYLQGIYVIPSRETSFLWFGVMFIRSGLYEDGIFRFNIILPEDFPEGGHPKVVFQSEIYHPVIHEDTNEVNLRDGFPQWNKGEQHIWQVLKYLHWIFYNFNSSIAHGVNKNAIELYKNNPDKYKEKIGALVKLSHERIYDSPTTEDKHYIVFEEYNPEVHDSVKLSMLSPENNERPSKVGHSWVGVGSFKPLNRSPSPNSESES